MAGNIENSPTGVQDASGARATAALGPNNRVSTATGRLGTIADQLLFAGPSVTGRWFMGDTRVRVCGVPTISASSVGLTLLPDGSTLGPMIVVQGDSRVRST